MKRRLLIGLAVVVVILGVLIAPFLMAFAGNAPAVDGTELASGARLVADGFALVYLVPISPTEVALVDCGVDKEGKTIKAELERRGLTPAAVTHIFLTHGHRDHTAACAQFPQATIAGIASEQALLDGTPTAHSPLSGLLGDKPTGLKLSQPLSDGQEVTLGAHTVKVFSIPGHTDGSAAYLIDGVLYLGDSAGTSTSNVLRPAPWVFSVDGKQNKASLVALAKRLPHDEVKQLAFGHTGPADASELFDFAP